MAISLGIYPIFRQTHTRWWFSWMLMAWFFLVIGIRGTMPKWLWAREKYLVVHTERASLAGSSFAQNLISKYRGFWKIGGSQGPIGFSTRMVNKNGMFFGVSPWIGNLHFSQRFQMIPKWSFVMTVMIYSDENRSKSYNVNMIETIQNERS